MLKFGKNLRPQIKHHSLPDRVEKNFLQIRKQKAKKKQTEKSEREKPDSVGLLRRDKIVNRVFRKPRL